MKLSRYANEDYLRMLLMDPGMYEQDYQRMKEKEVHSEAIYKDEPVPFLYMPRMFSRDDVDAFRKIVESFNQIADKVIRAYEKDPLLREAYGFPKELEELILLPNPIAVDVPMARYDLFYHSPKRFKFCEINTDGTSAMNEDRALVELFKETLAFDHFSDEYTLSDFELFDSWVDKVTELTSHLVTNDAPGLLILDNGNPKENLEFVRFRNSFEKKGYRAWIATPEEIRVEDGKLFVGDEKIDIVYRRLVTGDLMRAWDEYQEVVKAIKETDVIWVGPIKSQIVHNKLFFAILHDSRFHHLFTPSEIKFIVAHIPYTTRWTKAASEDERFYDDRAHYIIKPLDLYAGKEVYTGRDQTEEDWKRMLDERIDQGYILQEFVSLPKLPMFDFDEGQIFDYGQITGIFVYGGELQGLYSRAGRNSIITGQYGGKTLPTFQVRRR